MHLFTTSLWSLFLKSKTGCMTLNLLRISLCLAMSVARMHLPNMKQRLKKGRDVDAE